MTDPFAPDVLRVYLNDRGYPHACVRGHIEKRRCVRQCDCTIYVPESKLEQTKARLLQYREALVSIAHFITHGPPMSHDEMGETIEVIVQDALDGEEEG